jgi:hypothetical protein
LFSSVDHGLPSITAEAVVPACRKLSPALPLSKEYAMASYWRVSMVKPLVAGKTTG